MRVPVPLRLPRFPHMADDTPGGWPAPGPGDGGALAVRGASGEPTGSRPRAAAPSAPTQLPGAPRPVTGEQGWPVMIGPYRITGLLGRGGMGIVYAAEQLAPIRRRVAVKVIRTGLPAHVAARFASERQALALMEHPGIARVLDAGTTGDGAAWVAMEYVDGVPIGRWCDERRLPPRERVRLLAAVCHAVQHAHLKGIIHRDLKPSNVLVTEQAGVPQPKVIDFGIAKALGDAQLTGDTLATEAGVLVGTPAYMSPEQADGTIATGPGSADVDTRTDVYALGVLLYELLTGTLPLDPARMGLGPFLTRLMARLIDVPAPSARVAARDEQAAERAAARGRDPAGLARELRGDLDAIVLKALAPERERRYETALGLAVDLERHLAHEPIAARPPGAAYRLGKLVRRRPAVVAVAATALVSLVTLTAVSTVQARRVARASAVAEQRREQAEELIQFMVGDLRTRLEPLGKLDVLDAVGTRAMAYFAAVPAAELSDDELLHRSEALAQLGQVRLAQGDDARAMEVFRESLAQARDLVARDPERPAWQFQLGNAEYWVGYVHYTRGAYDSALVHFQPYVASARRLVARDSTRVAWQQELGYAWSNIASVREAEGDLRGALAAFRDVLRVKEHVAALAPADAAVQVSLGNSHNTLAVVHQKLGALDSARVHFAADLVIKRRLARRDPANAPHQEALALAHFFAGANAELRGDLGAARAQLDTASALAAALTARDPANVEWARMAIVHAVGLARVEAAAGRRAEALARLDATRRAARAALARHPADAAIADALAGAEREHGYVRLALGDRTGARQDAARAVALLAPPAGAAGGAGRSPRLGLALARARLLEAEASEAPAARRAALEAALAALGPAAREEELPRAATRARALVLLGRDGEAAPLIARLARAGYRGPHAPASAAGAS
jgi:serine/threonine protein kinase